MHTLATRLSLPTAAAVMAAGVIVASPPPPTLTALPAPVIHSVQMPDIQLTATVADILQFPAFRQWVVNQVDDFVTISAGLVKAGQGVGQTIAAIPGLVVTVAQQVLARDLVGALGTVEAGLIGAATAIGGPILVSVIDRNQRQLAVQQALQGAVPAALIGLGTGLLGGFNDVATSAIIAGQNVVAALLPINLGNLVTAVVDGVKLVVQGLSTGAGKVVDGIVFAQQTIAKALATQPAAAVAAVVPVAATSPASATGVTPTAVPKVAATTIKPAVKPVPTAATPTTTGTKAPTAPDTLSTTTGNTGTGTKPDTTGTGTTSSTDSGKSDTAGKTEKKPTPTKPKTKASNKTRDQKAAATAQAAA